MGHRFQREGVLGLTFVMESFGICLPRAFLSFLAIVVTLDFPCLVSAQNQSSFFVPIILSSSGQNGSFFTSELAFTNRGATKVTLNYRYTAAFGGGSGLASDSMEAGQQRIFPDAITYLKSLGVPIPDTGDRGGTLSVQVNNLASPLDFAITVRTTTAEPEGRAGLAYAAVNQSEGLNNSSYLFGLRENDTDRSNVALQNMGSPDQGSITLRVKIYAGDPNERVLNLPFTLNDIQLAPGEWRQISGILHFSGLSLSNGYVSVERIVGTAPYYAYAVINNQISSDGSFVPPVSSLNARLWTLPVIVENGVFSSDLVVTNLSSSPSAIYLLGSNGSYLLSTVGVGEQIIVSDLVQYLREHGVKNFGSSDQPFVGSLKADGCWVTDLECSQFSDNFFLGARTSTPGTGGRYGVYYNGVP